MRRAPLRRLPRPLVGLLLAGATVAGTSLLASGASGSTTPFLNGLTTVSEVASTLPSGPVGAPGVGDVNPYGVAVVPQSMGNLVAGDVLVSNFNDAANLQGTGRTIVEVSPSGDVSTFATILGKGVGLTTALGVLPNGFVIVGSLPTTDGTSATAKPGALFILDDMGNVVKTIKNGFVAGPWDLTVADNGSLATVFVSNVLNGTLGGNGRVINQGDVERLVIDTSKIVPKVQSDQIIAIGFGERTDPAALVVGPTGLALAADGTLYVADSVNNVIRAIPNALHRHDPATPGHRVTATPGMLNDPLGLVLAPNGDLITVNGGNGNAIEITPQGAEVATATLDTSGSPPGAGALFGLAIASPTSLYFVDDATNQLDLLSAGMPG